MDILSWVHFEESLMKKQIIGKRLFSLTSSRLPRPADMAVVVRKEYGEFQNKFFGSLKEPSLTYKLL